MGGAQFQPRGNYVSSSKAAEAAEVTGKCAIPATALGSLPRQSCGAAVFHRQSGGAVGGREEMPGEKAGSAEPPSPGCCAAASQDYAFNGGGIAFCEEREVSPVAMKSPCLCSVWMNEVQSSRRLSILCTGDSMYM